MPATPRAALARLAERAALEDPGVDSLDVVCAAAAEGGYAVDLHVVALPEDLFAMADRVRATVTEAARADGLDGEIAWVSVHVEDVVEPSRRPV